MQHLKINWLSNYCDFGYFFLLGLSISSISLFVFFADNEMKKISIALWVIYLGCLLIFKYPKINIITIFILIATSVYIFQKQTIKKVTLTDNTVAEIYTDQIKVVDGWLSGIAKVGTQRITISGNLTPDQEQVIKKSNKIVLSHITGEINELMPATNQGEFNFKNYYASQDINQKLIIKQCKLNSASLNLWEKYHQWRKNLQTYFKKLPRLLAFFASELILAENPSSENKTILDNYRDLGIIHLLSISGLHVGIYTLVVSTICYWEKLTEEETFLCCIIVLIFGILLSSGQAGFVRASLTYALGRWFKFKNQNISKLDILGIACLLHVLAVPRLFINIGAVLSYILAFGLQLTDHLPKLLQSVLLNILLTPLLLLNFYQVNILTTVFNLLIIPYFNWMILPFTFLGIVLGNRLLNLNNFLELLLNNTEKLINELAKTKLGLVPFGQIDWWQSAILFFISVVLLICCNEKTKTYTKLKFYSSISILFLYLFIFITIHYPLKGQVTFIDVGQGDSILITTPFPRKTYLIDTGGKLNFSKRKLTPQIDKITLPFLKSQGITHLDGVFVTHQDADHVGDLGPLLQQITVKKLFMAEGLLTNPSFKKRLDGKITKTTLVELLAGMRVKEPKINFEVLYPFKAGKGKNEDSLSLSFVLANKRWLFTGDLGRTGEKELFQHYPVKINYFKLGHHGSKTSSDPDFLKQIQPDLVFISAGRHNRFGHPHAETLKSLQKQQIPWASTQDCGMISWYYTDYNEIGFRKFLLEKLN